MDNVPEEAVQISANSEIVNIEINNELQSTDATEDNVTLENDGRLISSQGITKACINCSQITTKKGRALECGKCNCLVHYVHKNASIRSIFV